MNKIPRLLKSWRSNLLRGMSRKKKEFRRLNRLADMKTSTREVCLIQRGSWDWPSTDLKTTHWRMIWKILASLMRTKNKYTRLRFKTCFSRSTAWASISKSKTWTVHSQHKADSRWTTQPKIKASTTAHQQDTVSPMLHLNKSQSSFLTSRKRKKTTTLRRWTSKSQRQRL